MLQAASIYTQTEGERWKENEMLEIMLDIAKTSLQMLARDIFKQITKHNKGGGINEKKC